MSNHPNRNKIKDWPRHLRSLREKHQLTQVQLADKLMTSWANVENWETARYTPPAYLKFALERVLDDQQP